MSEITDSNGQSVFCMRLPEEPLFCAAEGIRYDFLHGLRVQFPKSGGPWHLTFADADTGTILFNQDCPAGARVQSKKTYYVRFEMTISNAAGEEIFSHTLDLRGKIAAIFMPVSTIGDTFAWFPYLEQFRQYHQCYLVAVLDPKFVPLFKEQYPDIMFRTAEQAMTYIPDAAYFIGLHWHDNYDDQPCDHRLVGLAQTAAYILGLPDKSYTPPKLDLTAPRMIEEPYVCIAAQSTCQSKNWTNPAGWMEVVQFLKDSGYRVLCVDRDKIQGKDNVFNFIPYGAEDFTGNLPLQERINLIKDADFFIGLASGLSWVANACGVPVVMISGFSHPLTEFETPYRVINYHSCNSCWNDPRYDFDHLDWMWCPRHAGTERQHECMRLISAKQVIDTIKTIPSFFIRGLQRECRSITENATSQA